MAEYRGKLYIFVDVSPEEASTPSVAEAGDLFELRRPGEMLWYLNGWAVGNNARSSYCARTSLSKMRNFDTFAEAKDCVRKKRKTRPTEAFHLVYEIEGRKSIVTSLEQIQQQDGNLVGADHRNHNEVAEYPELKTLTEKVGKIVATNALELFRTLAQEGEDAARARFSSATYQRLWQVLHEAQLVGASAAA